LTFSDNRFNRVYGLDALELYLQQSWEPLYRNIKEQNKYCSRRKFCSLAIGK